MAAEQDLRGVHQRPPGRLTALYVLNSSPKRGKLWLCRCDCGTEREVYAQAFNANFIMTCIHCRKGGAYRNPGPWMRKGLAANWKERLREFTPMQYYLFELIRWGRHGTAIRIEAVDCVLSIGDDPVDIENWIEVYSEFESRIGEARKHYAREAKKRGWPVTCHVRSGSQTGGTGDCGAGSTERIGGTDE